MDIKSPEERLEGPRLILRRYELADAAHLFETIEADRARLRAFLPWVDSIRRPEDEEDYVRSSALRWLEGKVFDFGIFTRDGDTHVGCLGVHTISWPDERAELGYWLTAAGEGHGYMSEAVALVEAELFRLGFHRIEIRCNDNNERSAGVPRRAGYVHEGTLREDTVEHGERRNTMVWGKLRK